MKYKTLLCDPPWPIRTMGKYRDHKHQRPDSLPYSTTNVADICALDVASLADEDSCLWLWTTNAFLPSAFKVMDAWGFKYHAPITWVKPSGCGSWFVSRTQFLLFGYRGKLRMKERFRPNVLFASPVRHSQKPLCSYELIEAVSFAPRVELFARSARTGWTALGDGIDGRDMASALAATACAPSS